MTNKELQELLKQYSDDINIKFQARNETYNGVLPDISFIKDNDVILFMAISDD